MNMILKSVPDDLLEGLPAEDQTAIRAAVGHPVKIVEGDDRTCRVFAPPNEIEIEWKAADGAIHTIWVDPSHLTSVAMIRADDLGSTVVVEYADMTAEQQRIVDAGNAPPTGSFPTGLTRDELSAWMKETFGW